MFFCQIKPVVVNHAAANRNQAVIPGKFFQNLDGWFQLGLEQYADVLRMRVTGMLTQEYVFRPVCEDAGKIGIEPGIQVA